MSSAETICEFIVELGDALCQLQLGRKFYLDFDNVFVFVLIYLIITKFDRSFIPREDEEVRDLLPLIGPVPILIPFKLFLVTNGGEIQISNTLLNFKAITLNFRNNIEVVIL